MPRLSAFPSERPPAGTLRKGDIFEVAESGLPRVATPLYSPAMTTHEERLVDTDGAAEILGVSRWHLIRLRCQGGGPPYIRLGRTVVRYRPADVLQWALDQRVDSVADERAASIAP